MFPSEKIEQAKKIVRESCSEFDSYLILGDNEEDPQEPIKIIVVDPRQVDQDDEIWPQGFEGRLNNLQYDFILLSVGPIKFNRIQGGQCPLLLDWKLGDKIDVEAKEIAHTTVDNRSEKSEKGSES